ADQWALLAALPANARRVWLRLLAPDDVADLVQRAPQDARDELLALLDGPTGVDVAALLEYKSDVAGGRMNPSYASLRPDMTVAQAVAYLRRRAADSASTLYYAYVVD